MRFIKWKLWWWKYLSATYHQWNVWAENVWSPAIVVEHEMFEDHRTNRQLCLAGSHLSIKTMWNLSWQWFWCGLRRRWKEWGFEPGPECRCPSWQNVCSESCNRPARKQLLLLSRSNHLQPSWQWVCILLGEPHAASQGRQRGRSGLYIFAYSAVTET